MRTIKTPTGATNTGGHHQISVSSTPQFSLSILPPEPLVEALSALVLSDPALQWKGGAR